MDSRLIFLRHDMFVETRSDGEGQIIFALVVEVQTRRGASLDPIGTNGRLLNPER